MLEGVLVIARADGLVQLAEHEALEGRGLQPDGARAEVGEDLAGAREEEVAREDRDGVAPYGLRARDAAAHVRLVHDVVVVQRREVRDLDGYRRVHHLLRVALAELGDEEREHRAHALAARVEQVARGDVGHVVREPDLAEQLLLDEREPVVDAARHAAVVRGREEALGEAGVGGDGGAAAGERDARTHDRRPCLWGFTRGQDAAGRGAAYGRPA